MSLQPLDATSEIPDAYTLALSESRRWVVLGYSSRSTLSLRAQGIGLPELRKQLEDEKEVLFGFLRFRRRGIVLQYTHPDCSRVVKARAQVHLQTVLNFFRDNDFLLETSTPKDITLDNIARLTNSTSTSTINSSKRSKRLTDIIEESPIQAAEEMEEIQSSSPNSDGHSLSSSRKPRQDETEPPSTPISEIKSPQTKSISKPAITSEITPVSPPATPRSGETSNSPSPRSQSPIDRHEPCSSASPPSSPLPILTFNSSSSSPLLPPLTAPPTPPPAPEKLRLLKALEIRRQKLSGKKVIKIPKLHVLETPPSPQQSEEDEGRGANSVGVSGASLCDAEDLLQFMEAQRVALEEQRRHISALEVAGKDLLSGWVNFQVSTSLVKSKCGYQVADDSCGDNLEGAMAGLASGFEKSSRWSILDDIRGVEVPDRDEEQLPHSLRINAHRDGAVFYIACQTAADMVNLRRVLGYCLNDERVFRCEG